MVLKKCLSSVLAISIAMPGTLVLAQSSPGSSISRSRGSVDAIDLLLQSVATNDHLEALKLLERAKALLEAENLPPENWDRISNLLETTASRIAQKSQSDHDKKSKNFAGTFIGPAPLQPDAIEAIEKLVKENPEVRKAMWEVGQGRLTKDTDDLAEIIRRRKGYDLATHDEREKMERAALEQPGSFVAFLKKNGWIDPDSYKDTDLMKKMGTLPIDELADDIIYRTLVKTAAIGTVKGLVLNRLDPNGSPSANWIQNRLGIGSTEFITFIVNVNLALRLTKLYGLNLNQIDEEALIMAVYGLTKALLAKGPNQATFAAMKNEISALGKSIVSKRGIGASVDDLIKRNPQVGKALKDLDKSVRTEMTTISQTNADHPPSDRNSEGKTQPGSGTENTTPSNSADSRQDHEKSKTSSRDSAKPNPKARAQQRLKGMWSFVVESGVAMAPYLAETFFIGHGMKLVLSSARSSQRQLENQSFRHYLMTAVGGEGIIKLLILSMDLDQDSPSSSVSRDTLAKQMKFILNLSRSARVCSPEDLEKYKDLTKNDPSSHQDQPSLWEKVGNLFSRFKVDSDTLNFQKKREENMLRLACDTKLSQDRYSRMIREFQTFNEIPHHYISDLRLAGRENRLRMGELLLQFYHLDGDFSPSEVEQFNNIRIKILGFTSPDDELYFTQVESFIRNHGGMTEDVMSPTGFTVADRSVSNPYDLKSGYFSAWGPDSPKVPSSQYGGAGASPATAGGQ